MAIFLGICFSGVRKLTNRKLALIFYSVTGIILRTIALEKGELIMRKMSADPSFKAQ